MSTTTTTIATRPGNFAQSRRRFVTVTDGLRTEAANVVREAFPRGAKVYRHPALTATALSRARNAGGPVYVLAMMFVGAHRCGDGSDAATTILGYLTSLRDGLWGQPEDMERLDVEESRAEGVENVCTLEYEHNPSPETARALAAAIRAEMAKEARRLAQLERQWSLNPMEGL